MRYDIGNGRRLTGRVTGLVLGPVIAAVLVAVGLAQPGLYAHAEASTNLPWSKMMVGQPRHAASVTSASRAYHPYWTRIDAIEASSPLGVEEKEGKFLLKNNGKTVLEVPKQTNGWLTVSIKRRFGGLLGNAHVIELNSNNPDVVVCYENEGLCRREFSSDIKQLRIRQSFDVDLDDRAETAGVLGQPVQATLLDFGLEGKIDGQPFLVVGRIIYDNTPETQREFREEFESKRTLQNASKTLLPVSVIVFFVVPFVWAAMKDSAVGSTS